MMMDWNGYRDQINAAVRQISVANPEIVKAYSGLSAANSKSARIDAKTRELIALAVAVTLRCDAGWTAKSCSAAIARLGDGRVGTIGSNKIVIACIACLPCGLQISQGSTRVCCLQGSEF